MLDLMEALEAQRRSGQGTQDREEVDRQVVGEEAHQQGRRAHRTRYGDGEEVAHEEGNREDRCEKPKTPAKKTRRRREEVGAKATSGSTRTAPSGTSP